MGCAKGLLLGWLTSRIWKKCKHGCLLTPFWMICRIANPKFSPEMKRSRDSDNCRYLVCLSTRSHHRARASQRWASMSKSANICIRNPWFWAKFCPNQVNFWKNVFFWFDYAHWIRSEMTSNRFLQSRKCISRCVAFSFFWFSVLYSQNLDFTFLTCHCFTAWQNTSIMHSHNTTKSHILRI